MKSIHSIIIEAFEYPTEQHGKVVHALRNLFSIENMHEKITTSDYGPEIKTLTKEIKKQQDIKIFIEQLTSKLTTQQKQQLIDDLDSRIDKEGNFYLRINKQALFENKIDLIYSGDVIKIKIKTAMYPVSKEKAKQIIKGMLV